MTEVEQEGQVLASLLADLNRAQGGTAHRTVSQVAPPRVGDALDRAVRGFEYGARVVRKMLAADAAADPFVAQMPKIIWEAMGDYQAFGITLSTWWSTCLSRRIEELERGDQAEPQHAVDVELDHGSD